MGTDPPLPRTLLSAHVDALPVGAGGALGREYRLLRDIVEGGSAAVAVLDTRLRYVYVNPHMARINGVPVREHLGRTLTEVMPGVERPVDVPLAVLRDGRPRDVVVSGSMGTGAHRVRRAWQCTYHRRHDERGEVIGLVAVGVEVTEPRRYVTELERAHGRMAMIHAATLRIGTTLDLERTCRELVDFVVRDLADGASVDLVVDDGPPGPPPGGVVRLRRAAVSRSPELDRRLGRPPVLGEVNEHGPASPVRRVLERGRPLLTTVPGRRPPGLRGPYADRLAEYRAAGIHSGLVVPLTTDSRRVGVLAMVRAGSSPAFTVEDGVVAQELAGRASRALERARHYAREHTMALELQRALLSEPTLPHPDLETASRYLPADDSAVVGGDWYDSLALPQGRNLLVIGDVMGHGVEAAVAMSHYRSMLRALASSPGLPLHEILHAADHMIAASGFDRVATCLLALGDPATDTISYANAGHLPPLRITPEGHVELVPLPAGPPLGTGLGAYETVTRPDMPGGTLLLYTDGLVERRDEDIDTSLSRLTDLRLPPGGDLDEILDGILAHAATGSVHDDIALLAARALGV
ncbi:serine phosphatase RsbU (regulator of sigma subunit) [Streptomyces sp. TLI_55]|uniref:SpoIIE family protein phosphatase n=1 Tax=Streptomyces sp. TLI_55 TaxID=1938861 RepID=UPI000BD047FB|nr:SpoIIE family protein phosphatase [Streptomyces sp. TLI_55]SNX64968.1 serine phosphatase RsbU (regulator of sigma subunit) [Streptomyces sp. TLI_55]